MTTYTVSVTGPGAIAPRFEAMLDVLPDAAMVGAEHTPVVTLLFDVSARSADAAIERAYFRAYRLTHDADVTLSVVRSSEVEGRLSWWRRLIG